MLDIDAGAKSPVNIDRSLIDNTSEEGQKFNFVFDELLEIPEFKELFNDIFGGNQTRFNVKFEIPEVLFGITNPTQPSNGQAVPNGNNITIKINKQLLTQNGTIKGTNLEIAKTIVHECVHAYLMIKATNPNTVQVISGAQNMDIQQLISATYISQASQHDFMYTHFTPVIKNIVSQLLNSLTTQPKRADCEELIIRPNNITNPSITTVWNWNDYFHYLSLNGLQSTQGFLTNFPIGSDNIELYNQYISAGHLWLNYNIID